MSMIFNSYLSRFPEPDNRPLVIGGIIEIVICMIPKDWIRYMAKAGMEPRLMTFQVLIDHLVTLYVIDAYTTNTND